MTKTAVAIPPTIEQDRTEDRPDDRTEVRIGCPGKQECILNRKWEFGNFNLLFYRVAFRGLGLDTTPTSWFLGGGSGRKEHIPLGNLFLCMKYVPRGREIN